LWKGVDDYEAKYYVEGLPLPPTSIHSWIDDWTNGSTTTLLLEVFTQRNFVADFIRLNLNFIYKNDKFAFEPLFGELEVTYVFYLWLVGKRLFDFLFTIELF